MRSVSRAPPRASSRPLTQGGSRVAATDDVTLRDRAESILFRDPKVPKGIDQHQRRARDRSSSGRGARTPGCGTSSGARPSRSRASGASQNLLHLPGEAVGDELAAGYDGRATS